MTDGRVEKVQEIDGSARIASNCANVLGESPVWSAREQALYWTDIREPALYRLEAATGKTRKWPMPELAGAVVLRESGGVIVCLQSGLYAFSPDTERLEAILIFERDHPDDRANDSRCDREGRLWYSRMRDFGLAPIGAIYCLDAALQPVRVVAGLSVPNAICFSPAGDRLYFADTKTGVLEVASLERASATTMERRALLADECVPGKPDGATVDAQGYIWNARFGGGCLVRCAPDGRVDAILRLPVTNPTSCSFGGRDLDRLYITTARQGLSPEALAGEPMAGALLVVEPGVKGLEEPAFRG